MNAKNYYVRSLCKERIRHKERVEWLIGDNPRWSCGTAVASYDRENFLAHSTELITIIDKYINPLRDPRNIK